MYVPVSHCGVVLEKREWATLAERLKKHSAKFAGDPCVRCKVVAGATLLLLDPSGNAFEFKSSPITAGKLWPLGPRNMLRICAAWVILGAFVLCWVLLLRANAAFNEVPAELPACAIKGSCVP
jgi:hypothetical protein